METVRAKGTDSSKSISVKIELSEKCRKCESFNCVKKLVQMRKRKRGKKSENNC